MIKYFYVSGGAGMDQFLKVLSDVRTIAAIAVVVVILIIWYMVNKARSRQFQKKMTDCQNKYNEIKNLTLQFKMNKANNLSKINSDTLAQVRQAQELYDRYESSIGRIAEHLSDVQDNISAGKLKKADGLLNTLNAELKEAEANAGHLNDLLDNILAEEVAQRQQVNAYKNRFRALKSAAQERSSDLSYCWEYMEKKISSTEQMFSTFEEWIYSSDFDKANDELNSIGRSLDEIDAVTEQMPDLLQDARGVIPRVAEEMHNDYVKERSRGVYLEHIQVNENLAALTNALKDDLKRLKNGDMEGIRANLDAYKKRIKQLDDTIHKEAEAFDALSTMKEDTEKMISDMESSLVYIKENYHRSSQKFGLESMGREIEKREKQFNQIREQEPAVMSAISASGAVPSTSLSSLDALHQKAVNVHDALQKMVKKINTANSDEDRASKQLIKLQIILAQINVKITQYRLPNISAKYDSDMQKAEKLIARIRSLMAQTPINMQAVNMVLQEALEFIYKLYNDVNNVLGTVVMAENTIVFGNRYRSTYDDIDSELTRAELAFRNGEYTQALSMAISTMEKIHPGNYEHMIKENAKGA